MKIGLVCSHGGHLTEMLQLMKAFEGFEIFFITYESKREQELEQDYSVYAIPNIGTNILRMMKAFPIAWRILHKERPDVLVSTGSEIAIPFLVIAKIHHIRTIFVESWCRVHSASGTGKVLYPFADVFYVQWPQLLAVYGPKATYAGGLL